MVDAAGQQPEGARRIEGLDRRDEPAVGTAHDHTDLTVAVVEGQRAEGLAFKLGGDTLWRAITRGESGNLSFDGGIEHAMSIPASKRDVRPYHTTAWRDHALEGRR